MPKPLPPLVHHPSTGFTLPEPLARRIDSLSANLPKDFTYRRLAKKSDEFTLDPGERTDVSFITTDALDRENQVVLPAGGDWTGYNRVVTFAHRYDQLPVGSNWWIRPKGPGLIAKTHYPDKPADWGDAPWLPSAILHLMRQPVPTCTGKSIGVLPLHIRGATPDELSKRPELRSAQIIDRWVGVEYAVVPVPCNPDAEMQAVAKGLELGLLDDRLLKLLNDTSITLTTTFQSELASSHLSHPVADPPLDLVRLRDRITREIHQQYRRLAGRID